MNSDKEIFLLIQKGDEEAVKSIFNRYYEGLCLYASSIVKDKQVAEEIVEDLFVNFWLNASKIAIHVSIKNYLFRSAHNNCLKYLGKLKTEAKRAENLHYTLIDHEIFNPVTPFHPISNLIVKELEEKAEKVLNALPEQCQKIYYLNRFEDLSYSQIAKKLGITIGTVKTQMSRAFKKLKVELKDYIGVILIIILGNGM